MGAADAGRELDRFAAQAKDKTQKADAALEGYRAEAEKKIESGLKEARKEVNQAADKFDKTVIEVRCPSRALCWVFELMVRVCRSNSRRRVDSLAGLAGASRLALLRAVPTDTIPDD